VSEGRPLGSAAHPLGMIIEADEQIIGIANDGLKEETM
jgi:hypothetical protein